jgi:hypothetical protein
MSTRPNIFKFLGSDDPREVELIQSLVEKTHQGKIPWVKQANALTATIPLGLQINFVLAPTLSFVNPHSTTWQLLTVRDASGSELVRVSNTPMVTVLAGAARSSLLQAIDELFILVNGAAGDDLDRAINTIKKL